MTIVRVVRRSLVVIACVTAVAASAMLAACGDDDARSDAVPRPGDVSGEVVVFAAASLTAAFTEIGDAFMAANPGVTVIFNFGASSDLARQIVEGAPADVFASADEKNMTKIVQAGAPAGAPVVFTTNALEIIVAPGNPLGIDSVADLADDDLIVVICAPEVPCGSYASQLFTAAGVTVTPKSLEENVKAVVTKVTLGEADAGLVYRTDVQAAGASATGVPIPDDINVSATYPMVITAEAPNPVAAQAFVSFVEGKQGQSILADAGFLAP